MDLERTIKQFRMPLFFTKTFNMKRTLKITAIACFMVLIGSTVSNVSAQYNDDYNNNNYYDDNNYDNNRDVSYQTFYDELSPHGQWIDYPGQGYVWVPDADQDFQPYSTNGHWVWTDDYEWMWVSDYEWGWAPFHYGRWDNDPYYGWYWVPGYEWSPAWVAWRDGGDYYGWAPIRPGININVNFNIGSYSPPNNFWCFAPRRHIASPYINRYYVDRGRNVTIINQTNIIINNYRYGGNYGFGSGPRRVEFERYTGRINPVRFRQSNLPGRSNFRGNEVSFYRPNVRQNNNSNRTVAPRQFERYERREGNFRNDRNNNATVRNNRGRPNDNINNRGNNLPDRRNIDRTNEGPNNRNNRQVTRQPERNNPSTSPRNNNSSDGRFDRRSDRGSVPSDRTPTQPNTRRVENDRPQRQPSQQMERTPRQRTMPSTQPRQQEEPRSTPQQQPRQFERRDNTARQPDRQMERQQPQQQPRQQMEQRQAPQQRTESRPAAQQPRQVERSSGNNRTSSDNRSSSGNGNRRRF